MQLLEKFKDKVSLKGALCLTVAFAIMYALISFSPIGIAKLLQITGGANILDVEYGYSIEKAYQILTLLGSEGRAFYISRIIPLDFLFGPIYMLFLLYWIGYFLKKIDNSKIFLNLILVFPALTMFTDWIENICTVIMLKQYPSINPSVYTIGSKMTLLKFAFFGISFTIIILLLAASIILHTRRKEKL